MVPGGEVVLRQRFCGFSEEIADVYPVGQTDDDQPGLFRHGQRRQAAVIQVGPGEHLPCRNSREAPVQSVGPSVVRAREEPRLTTVAGDLRAAVCAAVDESPQDAVLSANHQHGNARDVLCRVGTRHRNLAGPSDDVGHVAHHFHVGVVAFGRYEGLPRLAPDIADDVEGVVLEMFEYPSRELQRFLSRHDVSYLRLVTSTSAVRSARHWLAKKCCDTEAFAPTRSNVWKAPSAISSCTGTPASRSRCAYSRHSA